MPDLADVQRWVIPAVLVLAVLGVPLAVWWEKRHPSSYPGSRQQAGDVNLAWWRGLSTREQAACDAAALDGAQHAAHLVAERARINALYRP